MKGTEGGMGVHMQQFDQALKPIYMAGCSC